ncbi:MAG: phosphatase PAP2 family protein [Patescibacteria group bacterium]|nr:phosphatase PAP2 family protein [Patescibacteria group bacterium]
MDLFIFQSIHSFADKFKILDFFGVFLADYLPYLLFIAVLVFLWREKLKKRKLIILFSLVLAVIISWGFLVDVIRFFYDRPRPFLTLSFVPLIDESSPSFPSRHAAVLFAVAFVIFSFNKKWGYWFFGLVFLVGLARIFVGVHWPSDILGGFVTALLSFLIVNKLILQTEEDKEINLSKIGE